MQILRRAQCRPVSRLPSLNVAPGGAGVNSRCSQAERQRDPAELHSHAVRPHAAVGLHQLGRAGPKFCRGEEREYPGRWLNLFWSYQMSMQEVRIHLLISDEREAFQQYKDTGLSPAAYRIWNRVKAEKMAAIAEWKRTVG
jgi:hypothetical protein